MEVVTLKKYHLCYRRFLHNLNSSEKICLGHSASDDYVIMQFGHY